MAKFNLLLALGRSDNISSYCELIGIIDEYIYYPTSIQAITMFIVCSLTHGFLLVEGEMNAPYKVF